MPAIQRAHTVFVLACTTFAILIFATDHQHESKSIVLYGVIGTVRALRAIGPPILKQVELIDRTTW